MCRLALVLLSIVSVAQVARADEPKSAEKQPDAAEVRAVFEAALDVFGGAVGGNQFEQQFLPQFRRILTNELRFIRTVCKPTAAEQKTIQAAGDAALKSTLKKFGDMQRKAQQGRVQQQSAWPDPRQLIADALAESVRKTLSAEQAERYQSELEKRAAARKHAALANLVAKLDRDLILTSEQRDKLTAALESNWNDAWGGQLEVFLYGDDFLPVLPDKLVLPLLTEKQTNIWKATRKHQNTIGGWAGFGIGFFGDVDIEVEVVPADAPAQEPPP
jgi:hypothetical protein